MVERGIKEELAKKIETTPLPTQNLSYKIEDVFCQVNGIRIHYQVSGPLEAPPLVLVHGVGGKEIWWRENMPVFNQFFRTYAIDLPGFGRSKRLTGEFSIDRGAEFLQAWLKEMTLEGVFLLGHSMGGQISARLAANNPHIIKKLALVSPSGLFLGKQKHLLWAIKGPKVRVPFFSQTLAIAIGTMRTNYLVLAQCMKAMGRDKKTEESLSNLKAPTLLIWGSADGIVPPALGTRTLELINKAPARLEYIERGTHNLMFDQASVFNKLVLEFFVNNQVGN